MDDRELPLLEEAIGKIWEKAVSMGLDPFPTHFEIVPASILYEFGAYLLPGRFSHWTHGKAWYPYGGLLQGGGAHACPPPSHGYLCSRHYLLEGIATRPSKQAW